MADTGAGGVCRAAKRAGGGAGEGGRGDCGGAGAVNGSLTGAHQFGEEFRAAAGDGVVNEGAFAGQKGWVEIRDDHFFDDTLRLRAGEDGAIGAPDEGDAGVMGLIFVVQGQGIERAGAAGLIGKHGEAGVFTGAEGVDGDEGVGVAAGGGLTFRGVGPGQKARGMGHEKHLRAAKREHASDFRELIVVADDGADFRETSVEDSEFITAAVVIPFVT